MAVRRYHSGSRACQVSNPTDILSQSYGLGYFWSQKWGNAQNPLCHAHIPNFISGFCSCWGSNRILKIRAKFTKPISCENATKFGAQKFQRAQKRELWPKNRESIIFVEVWIRIKNSAGLAKHPFETNALFPLCNCISIVLVIFWMLWRSNILNASAQRLMNTKAKSSREIASIMRERLECLLGCYAPFGSNKAQFPTSVPGWFSLRNQMWK